MGGWVQPHSIKHANLVQVQEKLKGLTVPTIIQAVPHLSGVFKLFSAVRASCSTKISWPNTMSFEHASVTKGTLSVLCGSFLFTKRACGSGLMMGYALTSIICGVFDVKHYLHLQVSCFLY